MTRPKRDTKSKLIRSGKHFANVRKVGGSIIVNLSKPIREASEIEIGERVLIQYDPINRRITIEKDSDTAREGAKIETSNVKAILDQLWRVKEVREYGSREWCEEIERFLKLLTLYLKGDKIGEDS